MHRQGSVHRQHRTSQRFPAMGSASSPPADGAQDKTPTHLSDIKHLREGDVTPPAAGRQTRGWAVLWLADTLLKGSASAAASVC